MKSEEFKRQLKELNIMIADAGIYFAAWRSLVVDDDLSARALNRYRGLFLPARNAMLWMALMQIAKFFDRDRRAVSVRNLLRAAKANPTALAPHAISAELDAIEARIAANQRVLKRLKALRDQRIAHHDAVAARNSQLLYGDIPPLIEDMIWVFNELQRGHDRSITSFDFSRNTAKWHASEVVRLMREEMDNAAERIRQIETDL